MQHHQHATRASTAVAAPPPPHMLVAGQHIATKYATPTQQQPQPHHVANIAVATTPGDANFSTQQQHMRDVRLQHQAVYPIPPQSLRSAAPMHKVLQQQQQTQHQHLNNNNNNNNNKTRNNNINNNKNTSNHHHQQQQPMHAAVLQQHPQHLSKNKARNIITNNSGNHHHHQQPHPPAAAAHHYPQHLAYATHINATASEHMGVATQQQQQTQPPAAAPPPPLPDHQRNGPTPAYHQQAATQHHHTMQPMQHPSATQQQQKMPQMAAHHYYNANGHNGGGTYTIYTTQTPHVPPPPPPKQILQNPNRVLKPRQQQQPQQQQLSSATPTPTHRAHQTTPAATAVPQSNTVTTNEPKDEQQQPEAQQINGDNVIAPSSDNKENVLNLEQIQTDLKKLGEHQHNNEQASNCSSNGSTIHKSNINNNNNNNQSNILSNEDLSVQKNSKEKTPMCLVNELARYNKIIHQYRLTSEKGPAHCKRFTVTLKLGEEEYSAEGYKIKKAQHLAAAEAIEKTKYKHPVPKTRRNEDGSQTRAHITPTVELNALAMKLGQQTYYLFDPRQMAEGEQLEPVHGMPQQPSPPPTLRGHVGNGAAAYQQIQTANGMPMPVPNLPPHPHHPRYMHAHAPHGPAVHPRGMYPPKYPQRYPIINGMIVTGPPPPAERYFTLPPHRPTKITLIVGKQKFVGLGRTLQQAKHDAAARALQALKTQTAEQQQQQSQETLDTSGSQDSDNKSPISKVHEIGIRRNMSVHFKVLREEGPAHMKNFVTACVVGSIMTEGEGNGKKISKKRSAEKMLEELRKLPPLTPTKSPLKRIKVKTPGKMATTADGSKGGGGGRGRRANNTSTLKEKQHEDDNTNDEDNPITKLIQIQQGRKEKEPTFELISKNASEHSRRREFIIEVTAQGRVARGTGPNKKIAKRNAAQNLLISMDQLEAPMDSTSKQNVVAAPIPIPAAAPLTADPAAAVNIINSTNTTNQLTATSNDTINANTGTAIKTVTTRTVSIENLEVPLIATPAGQVPGILILRQNKKHASKRKEAVVAASKDNDEVNETAAKHHEAPPSTIPADTTIVTTTHSTNPAVESSTQRIAKPTSSNGITDTTSSTAIPASTTATAAVSSTSNSSSNTLANGSVSSETSTSSSSIATTTTSTTTSSTTKSSGGVHMKDQLLYLAKLLGFEVNFSDYPKGNHSEFLTIVTLSSDPPQICHGVGANSEESQNDAAKNALKILSELGLNCGK